MNIAKYYWDLNKTALKETKAILKNHSHPKFAMRMVTLLSRCDNPKELFSFFSKKDFIEFWPSVKAHWVKISRESDFRDWWQTIYEQIPRQYKQEELAPKGVGSVFFLKVGRAIREARVQRGLSQKELAIIVKIRQPDISKIEEGKKNITLKTLFALSKALNIEKINLG